MRRTICLALLLWPGGAATGEPLAAPPHRPVFQKGMSFAHGYSPQNNLLSPVSQTALEHLRQKVHVEWIALNPFSYQRTASDPSLYFGGDPPDAHLVHAIEQAHALGLQVMLKPHIWLQQKDDDAWRGRIGMNNEPDWRLWFENYERFILHYARIAEREQVDIFCIGVELARTMKEREQDWRALIDRIRQVYHGPITYAANWWGEYDEIHIWDALDYVGINAFFPLSETGAPDLETLRVGARRVADEVELLQLTTHRPVIFTEVGYKSVRGATVTPWEWPRRIEPAVDLELQSRAYQAVLEVMWQRPWFYGMYWWKWHSHTDHGGPRDGDFTPRGKPAERTLSQWYQHTPTGAEHR
ncbi:MAG: hypothetical protein O2782_20655 [bacterium]|nr:hypothetical protein [bacterium]